MKSIIRKEIIARRNSITYEEVAEKSAIIQQRVMDLPSYVGSETITLYASIKNEVLTSLIFDKALKEGKNVLFPYILKDRLIFLPVKGKGELVAGPFGILSPVYREGENDSIDSAGMVLIPGVAYDIKGGRLGYGRGFYDKSLQRLRKRPFVVAPAYEFQMVEEIPVYPHDVMVDAIITERRVIICKG